VGCVLDGRFCLLRVETPEDGTRDVGTKDLIIRQ
jgi:hypothetical protein